MKRSLLIAALVLLPAGVSSICPEQSDPPGIGPLDNQELVRGCGCYFEFPSTAKPMYGPYVVEIDRDGTAYINFRGVDIKLTYSVDKVSFVHPKLGDPMRFPLQSEAIKVVVDVIATKVCPEDPNVENCEVTDLEGTVKVVSGNFSGEARVRGQCGC